MVIGIAGGLILFGLLAGALSGYILLAVVLCTAGLGIAALCQLHKQARDTAATRSKLAAYPSYKY